MIEHEQVYASRHGSPGVWVQDPQQRPQQPSFTTRARRALEQRFRSSRRGQRWLSDQFHTLYYESAPRTWLDTRWRSVPVAKCPFDLWVYQELVTSLRPQLIIETGTFSGGSALYFADLLDHNGGVGKVVSIDLDSTTEYPVHPRIEYLTGSSVSDEVLDEVRRQTESASSVLVVLDSDHRAIHVAEELEAYHDLVTVGSYLVVEDTNVNGHPALPSFGPGPYEAVQAFLGRHPEFRADASCEKFFVSFNNGGWLRRVS